MHLAGHPQHTVMLATCIFQFASLTPQLCTQANSLVGAKCHERHIVSKLSETWKKTDNWLDRVDFLSASERFYSYRILCDIPTGTIQVLLLCLATTVQFEGRRNDAFHGNYTVLTTSTSPSIYVRHEE